jgi:hypothetical protein
MSRKLDFSVLIAILLCVACVAGQQSVDLEIVATAEYLERNPQPTPEYLNGQTSRQMTLDGSPALCVSIRQSVLQSDTTAQITIDGENATHVETWVYGGALLQAPTSASAFKDHCFSIGRLSPGLHLANIQLTVTSGQVYTYSWSFRVSEALLIVEPAAMPTLVPLPTLTPSSTP